MHDSHVDAIYPATGYTSSGGSMRTKTSPQKLQFKQSCKSFFVLSFAVTRVACTGGALSSQVIGPGCKMRYSIGPDCEVRYSTLPAKILTWMRCFDNDGGIHESFFFSTKKSRKWRIIATNDGKAPSQKWRFIFSLRDVNTRLPKKNEAYPNTRGCDERRSTSGRLFSTDIGTH